MASSRSFAFKLAYLARMVRKRFDYRARNIGLTRAQWQTMAAISLREGMTQSEIAAELEVSSVTIGRLVERLEQDSWIERRPDRFDRRAYRLFIQPQTLSILEELDAIVRREEQQLLDGLSAEECVMFGHLLDRAIRNMEERDTRTAPNGVAVADVA